MASSPSNHRACGMQSFKLDGWLDAWMRKRARSMNEKLSVAGDEARGGGLI